MIRATRSVLDRVIDSPSKVKFESGLRPSKWGMVEFCRITESDTNQPKANAENFPQKQGIRHYPHMRPPAPPIDLTSETTHVGGSFEHIGNKKIQTCYLN